MAYLNKDSKAVAENLEAISEEEKENWTMIRHGYGLQIYHGQRNADGILTKYEGKWEKD